jgi:hypothetical protein
MRTELNINSIPVRSVLVICFMMLITSFASAQYNENVIKAAYIERITRFVEWPGNNQLPETFVIGVYAETGFYKTLTEIFKEKMIKDHKVTVILIKKPEEINTCNMCYLSDKAELILDRFVAEANSSGVLLISASKDFGKSGVHINFYIEEEKLKFEINEVSLASAGFRVSYLLMQNTRIVQ